MRVPGAPGAGLAGLPAGGVFLYMGGPPPPLPRILAAEMMELIMAQLGDRQLADRVGDALNEHAKERLAAARQRMMRVRGLPTPPFEDDTGPGSPADPLSEEAAQALFEDLAGLDYVPFDYPKDGCPARAHEMCRVMRERGIDCAKAWNFGVTAAPNIVSPEFGGIRWVYHVAPIVCVRQADGSVRQLVLDPSIDQTRPLTVDEWLARQGGPAGQRLELTDDRPYAYRPTNIRDTDDQEGTMIFDADYAITNATLDYFSVQRDLVRAGLI